MNKRPRVIDWKEISARLERTRLALDSSSHRSPEEVARILKDRALALATPMEDLAPSVETIELLVFSLAGERFGIETAHVLEVSFLRDLIPVPCTPAFVLGVDNYRGRILAVLDLRQLLNLPGESAAKGGKVIWTEARGVTIGIVVDAVAGISSVSVDKVVSPPEALTGLRLTLTRGITEELVTVLDLDAMTRTPDILVNDEVGEGSFYQGGAR